MAHMTTESDDEMLSRDLMDSPVTDEGNGGGSGGGSTGLKKGPWTSAEDAILVEYVRKHGEGNWNAVQKHSGLSRCGKSCRLRWANHLRPNLKKGAFTPEEERTIIELHAKMGNKWARMAAHLPGRTDNEIKNYWNTRIKRRQRAGLPLYPPEVCMQQLQESHLNQNIDSDGLQNDPLQPTGFEIPEVIFDNLKDTQAVLPFIPEIPCMSSATMLMNTLNPPSDYFSGYMPQMVHRPKRPRETATSFFAYSGGGVENHSPLFEQQQTMDDNCGGNLTSETFGSSFKYDTDPLTNNHLSFGVNQGCHSLINNGNISTSKLSSSTASKVELPSLQYPETDFSSWGSSSSPPPPAVCESVDAFIQSPPRSGVAIHSDYSAPKSGGLLDELLHEAKTRSSKSQKLSHKSQHSSALVPNDVTNCSVLAMSEGKWDEYGDSISPLGNNSAASIFSDCTPLSGSGSSFEENPPETLPGGNFNTEARVQVWPSEENRTKLDCSRPDALLDSSWFGQDFVYEKDQGSKSDYISAPLHDDLGSDQRPAMGDSAPNQEWAFDQWNNMPTACQISDLP